MALQARSPAIVRFGTFEVDVRAGELRKQGVRIKLQEQPFHVLTVLLERPGDVVTREELRSQVWPADTFVDFDNSLNTSINKLREALGDSADNPRFIETLPRRGYRFLAPVHRADIPESHARPFQRPPHEKRRQRIEGNLGLSSRPAKSPHWQKIIWHSCGDFHCCAGCASSLPLVLTSAVSAHCSNAATHQFGTRR